ncbi:ATP-dependent 6-phosphofructokinase [Paucidesulfovibrio longus]|uniref:ATP-dependent 6-phosphofructokinase n=1 Tax=Paucidesulfovibrio longus TaxID=889 RepID=UPI0003B711B0|nr:ATP-dependent 6-phosphofructokinase [Paucidesulfovibrio longus]
MSKSKETGIRLDTAIPVLGEPKVKTGVDTCRFVDSCEEYHINLTDEDLDEDLAEFRTGQNVTMEKAGPRQYLYFDPSKTRCAVVTCGGLCPGINDVIRAIVLESFHNYNVQSVIGIPFGLQGFVPSYGHEPIALTPESVANIHQFGGTMLGSSRGPQDPAVIVDTLERMNVNCLFIIGGDGTMRAAQAIVEEITRRGIKIAVIGVPKTIDNDISFVTRSFGFDTAVEKATEAIQCAHVEATGVDRGIGMVKVMGRESGFIAGQAALALKEVNYVLIPECRFDLDGPDGLLESLDRRLENRRHAVIVCAEGAGQEFCSSSGQTDASGNPVLCDISSLLIDRIKAYFREKNKNVTIKFIDPSYIIRSVPANANDRVYCGFLGQHAVHAAMAGKTGMVVSQLQSRYVHLPLHLVTRNRKTVKVKSDFWHAVLESTGQELRHCKSATRNGFPENG